MKKLVEPQPVGTLCALIRDALTRQAGGFFPNLDREKINLMLACTAYIAKHGEHS